MNGRRRVFAEQFLFGGLLVTALSLLQFFLVAVLRTQFMDTTTYLLYNVNGHITVIPESVEFAGLLAHRLLKALFVHCVFFGIAELLPSALGYFIVSTALSIAVQYGNSHITGNVLNSWNSALIYSPGKEYSLGWMLLVKVIGLGIFLVFFFFMYFVCMHRNIRTQYEG